MSVFYIMVITSDTEDKQEKAGYALTLLSTICCSYSGLSLCICRVPLYFPKFPYFWTEEIPYSNSLPNQLQYVKIDI